MATTWRRSSALSPEERLEVLDLMNRLETQLGREAIDEARRRTVVHGWSGEHWLRYEGARLRDYALAMGEPDRRNGRRRL